MSNYSVPAETATPARRLLRGGADIAEFILQREANRSDIRWLYGQLPNFAGAIWRLAEDGELLAWTDALEAHLELKAAEAKAASLAAAEAKAAEKEAVIEAAREAAAPKPAQARPRKSAAMRRRSSVAAE